MTSRGRRSAMFAAGLASLAILFASSTRSAHYEKAPEFPSQNAKDWIGTPQSLKGLRGHVVILDVWTFG
jgi:hypothetical protein